MWPVSAKYLDAIRYSHVKLLKVDFRDLWAGRTTTLAYTGQDASEDAVAPYVTGGSITVDATSNVRRTLTLSLPARQGLWDVLDTVGGELTVSSAVDFRDGSQPEWVPLGKFILDVDSLDYGGGDLSISTAPDRWSKVQSVKMRPGTRSSVPSNTAWQEIVRLVQGAWSAPYTFPGWAFIDKTATTQVGSLYWDDGEREPPILQLCADNGLEVFFDAQGLAVLRKQPSLSNSSVPVWTVDAGASGVLTGGSRTRDRTRAFNAIELSTSASDITFVTVVAENANPADPLSTVGPLGYKSVAYSSPTLRNSDQAKAAGKAMLAKSTGVARQLSLSSSQNDALDAGDVIQVVLPRTDINLTRPAELQIIDTLSIPFDVTTEQDLQLRSTVPDTLGS